MKRLYLLRHSKAGHANKKLLDDQDRPITDKGIELCIHIAEQVKGISPLPQLIISSSALRAKQTAELLVRQMEKKIRIQLESGLYLAEPTEILGIIQNADESASSLMVIGHNPGLQEFAMRLAGKGNKKKFREMRANFPPPSLAVFDIDVEHWFDVDEKSGELMDFIIGKTVARKKAA